MPLEVELAHIVQLVGIVLLVLAQVEHKVAVVPVGVVGAVLLATITLRSSARGVTPKTQARIGEGVLLALGAEVDIAVDVGIGVVVTIILAQQLVPLVERHGYVNLGQHTHIEHPVELTRRPGRIRIVGIHGQRLGLGFWLGFWLVVVAIAIVTTFGLLCRVLREDKRVVLDTTHSHHHQQECHKESI